MEIVVMVKKEVRIIEELNVLAVKHVMTVCVSVNRTCCFVIMNVLTR